MCLVQVIFLSLYLERCRQNLVNTFGRRYLEIMKKLTDQLRSIKVNFPYESPESLHQITTNIKLKDSSSLEELGKLSNLIKSHLTKVGILSSPDKITNNESLLSEEILQLSNKIFYVLSLLQTFYQGHFTDYFVKVLDENVVQLIISFHQFSTELIEIVSLNENEGKCEDRLVSIGKMWSICDQLMDISKKGNLGLLFQNIIESSKLINDTILELQDWLMDPTLESDDPFGLHLSDNDASGEEAFQSPSVLHEVISFVEKYQFRFKLLKLLLVSFAKSININEPHTKSLVPSLQNIDKLHRKLVAQVDELTSDTFLLGPDFSETDPDITQSIVSLENTTLEIVSVMKSLNKLSDKKSKWLLVWNSKWQETCTNHGK